jgi:hypothetical protein
VTLPPDVTLRSGDVAQGEKVDWYLNAAPIYEFSTPNGACYVVPLEDIHTLTVRGYSADSAVAVQWSSLDDQKIQLRFCWNAEII